MTCRQTLSPVGEVMPDRCTPEYERVVAKMGASLPYRRARTLLSEFLPLDDIPSVETARQRTIRVGARLSADDRQTGTNFVETIDRIRWRLWHGQVARALDLISATLVTLDGAAGGKELVAVAARKVARLLRGLETYICGQSDIIIDYATARQEDEPISTAVTESTVQWLLHRRMNAQQHMRWSPRGAHLMLKVRTATANGTLERDYAVAERWARRPFRRAA